MGTVMKVHNPFRGCNDLLEFTAAKAEMEVYVH
jgi:hypothetical protein